MRAGGVEHFSGDRIERVATATDMDKTNGVARDVSSENLKNATIESTTTAVSVPKYGVKLKFNHIFPEKRTQNLRPSVRQTLPLIPLAWRWVDAEFLTLFCGGAWTDFAFVASTVGLIWLVVFWFCYVTYPTQGPRTASDESENVIDIDKVHWISVECMKVNNMALSVCGEILFCDLSTAKGKCRTRPHINERWDVPFTPADNAFMCDVGCVCAHHTHIANNPHEIEWKTLHK